MVFQCPGGTKFQQRTMVCDHWNHVKCQLSDQYYAANLRIGQKHMNFIDDGNFIMLTNTKLFPGESEMAEVLKMFHDIGDH